MTDLEDDDEELIDLEDDDEELIGGFTSSSVKFAGFDVVEDTHGANFRFDITDEDQEHLATFNVFVDAQPEETLDAMLAEAHRKMCNVLKQWHSGVNDMYKHYSKRAGIESQ